jgi:5S rRNA maturation endonuclease (ribonuclease M5)/energy-coupling factor transporter ATP-binding protein EcfA2
MLTRDQIIESHPIVEYLESIGVDLHPSGKNFITNICPKYGEHRKGHRCVMVYPETNSFNCHDCNVGGSIIDWQMLSWDMPAAKVMEQLSNMTEENPPQKKQSREIETYDYTNESGQLLYQVVRYEPKTFKQRQPKDGDWQWNLDDVTRVLYNLPQVVKSQVVCICEGEKDCNTLIALGYTATTSAGGSSSWLDAYSETLRKKDLIVFPDNDPVGRKYADAIINSCKDKANSIKVINSPAPHRDITEWLDTQPAKANFIKEQVEGAAHTIPPLPVYSMREVEERYIDFLNHHSQRSFNMKALAPKFEKYVKPLAPGEMCLVVADTGLGKTSFLQCIARVSKPNPVLFFELELPAEKIFEKQVMNLSNCYDTDVQKEYRNDPTFRLDNEKYEDIAHIFLCDKAGISMEEIEALIKKSALKIGQMPSLVILDYVGLIRKHHARSRYEQVADTAEQAKVIAKRCGVVVFMAAQVSRPTDKKVLTEVQLHSARGAGELEASANLVLGLTRPDDKTLKVKIVKNNFGKSGASIDLDFKPETMQISERVVNLKPF